MPVIRKLLPLAAACGLAALALGVGVLGLPHAARADDPTPTPVLLEDGAGIDEYYIRRGWTNGLDSPPEHPQQPAARPQAVMPYSVTLPVVMGGEAPKETRALYVTRWDFMPDNVRGPADISTIVDQCARAHMNVIFFQVHGTADAVYSSRIEPWWYTGSHPLGQNPGWDPLADIINKAHAKGIEVHAWLNVYPAWLGTTPPPATTTPIHMYPDFNQKYGTQWLQWSPSGPMQLNSSYLCANPAFSAVTDRVVAVCTDLLSRYALDGLHFDYIRYDAYTYSYDPVSNQAYAAAQAAEPGLTREEWQRRQVTNLIARVRAESLPHRPQAHLTAAVWPCYQYDPAWNWPYWSTNSDGYHGHYQDSQGWARSGLLDGIMPMLYSVSFHDYPDRYKAMVQNFVQGSGSGAVIAGIQPDYTSFSDIAWRIEAARDNGAKGEAFLSYHVLWDQEHTYGRDYWQALADGPYQRPAVPYWPR